MQIAILINPPEIESNQFLISENQFLDQQCIEHKIPVILIPSTPKSDKNQGSYRHFSEASHNFLST